VRVSHAVLVPQTDAPSSGLSSGALIGIVSGSVVLLALIVGVGIFLVRHRAANADVGSEIEFDSVASKRVVETGLFEAVGDPNVVNANELKVESETNSEDLFL
jgi:hypothetical protein